MSAEPAAVDCVLRLGPGDKADVLAALRLAAASDGAAASRYRELAARVEGACAIADFFRQPRPSAERDQIAVQMVLGGSSNEEVSLATGVSPNHVTRIVRRAGIRRGRGRPAKTADAASARAVAEHIAQLRARDGGPIPPESDLVVPCYRCGASVGQVCQLRGPIAGDEARRRAQKTHKVRHEDAARLRAEGEIRGQKGWTRVSGAEQEI